MNLRTPLFLALTIGSVCAIIFLIWPEFQKIDPKQKEVDEKTALVDSILEKNGNIASLTQSLGNPANATQKDFVLGYIPLEKKEELIFNSINNIANADGVKVALSNVSMQLAKEDPKAKQEEVPPALTNYPIAGAAPAKVAAPPKSFLPAEKIIKVDIATAGSYEGQKNFIAKLYALDMFKRISAFSLAADTTENEGAKDILNGAITAEFVFIPEAKIGKDYNNAIFSQKSFNFEVVEELRTLLSQKMTGVLVGEAGRVNPFLP